MLKKYNKIRTVHRLQKNVVRQCLHNVVSPMSAVSGYLELMNYSLKNQEGIERIENYRQRIESGIFEINNIIEQLSSIYQEDGEDEQDNSLLSVDINWVVQEICNNFKNSYPKLTFKQSAKACYVFTDLYITKLILFNLINNAVKISGKHEAVNIEIQVFSEMVSVMIHLQVTEKKKEVLQTLFEKALLDAYEGETIFSSFDLGLTASSDLAPLIGGRAGFSDGMDGNGHLYLMLPVSNEQ